MARDLSELKGTKTEKNLEEAFAGESKATNKYLYYASQARKDGYQQIADIFEETAGNERMHAKVWFKYLQGGEIKSTTENLKDAAEGENYEWTEMYKKMAEEAREEGFTDIASKFEQVGDIEERHEKRYLKLKGNVDKNQVFERDEVVAWQCDVCGHIHVGKSAPKVCPVCNHPQSHFFISADNY